MPNIFNDDFQDFISALNKADVSYVLVGGMAVLLHGYMRTTGDMDIWVAQTKENYKKVVIAFKIFQMPIFDMTEEKFLSKNYDVWSFGREPVRIDLMTEVKGIKFDEAYQKSKIYEESGISIRYLHLSNLIQAKRASGRHKDLDDIENLEK